MLVCLVCKYLLLFCSYRNIEKDLEAAFRDTNEFFFCLNYETYYQRHNFVPPVLNESKNGKKPIVILGCSFAEGSGLSNEEKFSNRLHDVTKRDVYNRAMFGQGLQYMLYQLEDENFYKELPEPEYVIYVYMWDQIRRLYKECAPWMKSPFYEEKENGELKKIENPFYYMFPMVCVRYFQDFNDNEKTYSLLRKHFIYAKELADKHWKNAKWILLIYDEYSPIEQFEELKKYGYTIAPAKDLVPSDFYTNLKYRLSAKDVHPSKEAWLLLTPKFVKKYIK